MYVRRNDGADGRDGRRVIKRGRGRERGREEQRHARAEGGGNSAMCRKQKRMDGEKGGKNGRIKVSKTVRISRLMCSREARICSTAVNSGCTPRGRSTNRTRPQQ